MWRYRAVTGRYEYHKRTPGKILPESRPGWRGGAGAWVSGMMVGVLCLVEPHGELKMEIVSVPQQFHQQEQLAPKYR